MTSLLKPRHRWFYATCPLQEEFPGPFRSIDEAIQNASLDPAWVDGPLYVMQGYKMKKSEREEMGVEFLWQCESDKMIEIKTP